MNMEVLLFFVSVFVISFSGAMAPGAVTAATISLGVKKKYAGAMIAVGHGIIELPLIFLLMAGFDKLIDSQSVMIAIGYVGGAFLLWMGLGLVRNAATPDYKPQKACSFSPILAGIILSASNPYFVIWWITVGLKLATEARQFGFAAFLIFTFVHWLCDLTWFQLLSFASFKGSRVMSDKHLKIILAICGAAMLCFGLWFIYDATSMLVSLS